MEGKKQIEEKTRTPFEFSSILLFLIIKKNYSKKGQ